ncbi:unnamed protein product [Camellia sinensis]
MECTQQQQHVDQNNASMELINSVTGTDVEGQSRQRILTFASRSGSTVIEGVIVVFKINEWGIVAQLSFWKDTSLLGCLGCDMKILQTGLDMYSGKRCYFKWYVRRIVFEGLIVDPDQGVSLPCGNHGLANSALPALPGDSQKVSRPAMVSTVSWPYATGQLSSANRETDFLRFREAWSLLHSAADVAGRSEILKAFPMHRTGTIRPNPESMFRVLSGMYFPGKQDRISRSARIDWENDDFEESGEHGNLWRKIWNGAPALPASEQKLLLDPNREGEKDVTRKVSSS